jgi:tRNA uridine 5-carboxymethylaminomethyl modification enzyme
LDAVRLSPQELSDQGILVRRDGVRRSLFELMGLADLPSDAVRALVDGRVSVSPDILDQLARDALYAPYVARQVSDVAALQRDEAAQLPADLDYRAIAGLSHELAQKLAARRPANLAEAAHVEGMTPSALLLLLARTRRISGKARAG